MKEEESIQGKIIVVSAPSGTGKSTIINAILENGDIDLHFSVSATNREPRKGEQDGVNYRFLTTEQFRFAIDNGEFVEWEEVYPGRFYGTLKSEIERVIEAGHNVILDIDVKGALNVKQMYGDEAFILFIKPPSIETLRQRLSDRGTETPESLKQRIDKAEYELGFASQFDRVIVNDILSAAVEETRNAILSAIAQY